MEGSPNATASVSSKAIAMIREGKNARLKDMIPKGQSPAVYIDLIKTQVLGVDRQNKPRPDEDMLLFLYTCKRTGLDPLTKQIYAIYRWNNRMGKETMTIQTGIDGMRLVAQRSGQYAGQDDVVYLPEDEADPHPTKASVTVYKQIKGSRVSFAASARWSEYVQTDKDGKPQGLWAKMPYLMLGKTAEALALRKAFPNELSGIYATEEIAPAQSPLADLPTPGKLPPPPQKPAEPVEPVEPTKSKSVAEARAKLNGGQNVQ
ncbi:MAG: phage recombination protein Bet [Bacteroidales bacterium]|jgi:phage recombination protein Bet